MTRRYLIAHLPRLLVILHDLGMVCLTWIGLRWLALEAGAPPADAIEREIAVAVILQGAVLWQVGLYRGVWRFASLPDLKNLMFGALIGVIAIVLVNLTMGWLPVIPRRVLIPYPIVLVFLLGAPRLLYRLWKDKSMAAARQTDATRILILGAGRAAETLLRDLRSDGRYKPVGLLDDTLGMRGAKVQGVPVLGGLDELSTIANETASKMLVIAMPSATAEQMQRVVSLCDETGLPFRTVRRVADMLESPHGLELKEVAIEDLLGREPVNFDWEKVSLALGGKHLLITGAGGSIGSELVRQCARAGAARLVLMERHELALHDLLTEMRRDFPHVALQPMLADCGDPAACRLALRGGVEMVFHAAAFKHVPMLEDQLREAMRNNVLASITLMRACCEAKVPEFVLISTDKAIAPANVLGASKRFAELACQLEGARGGTRLTVVRFGNVLDSAGSVVPLFRRQIAAGGPVTVTDPEVTRFFMTIPEACQLILQTSLLESLRMAVYTLDMGQPIAIKELAQQMIRLAGKRPERDIEIIYTGLRAGEKMHEMLFHPDESYLPTRHPRILQARPRPLDAVKMEKAVEKLARLLGQGSDDMALLMLLQEVVTDFEPGPGLRAIIEPVSIIDQQSSA